MALSEIVGRLKPIQDFVCIEREAAQMRTSSGLYIPASAAESQRAYQGKVLAVGPGCFDAAGKRLPMPDVKVGDVVVFGKYAGAESALENDDFWLIRAELLDAVIDP
jgi:chaperonin GroES